MIKFQCQTPTGRKNDVIMKNNTDVITKEIHRKNNTHSIYCSDIFETVCVRSSERHIYI